MAQLNAHHLIVVGEVNTATKTVRACSSVCRIFVPHMSTRYVYDVCEDLTSGDIIYHAHRTRRL